MVALVSMKVGLIMNDNCKESVFNRFLIALMLTCAQLAVELEPSQRWHDLALEQGSEP